ncbi:MAG: GIY-YIG nuclease family protein [Alphaproteobacteria bacterium]
MSGLRPTVWERGKNTPQFNTKEPFIYALIRNHGRYRTKNNIVYVGLTNSPETRFGNHEKARSIAKKRGRTEFSYAPIDFITHRDKLKRIDKAMEEIEHLLIWALGFEFNLRNERKQFTLPGMGKNGANAWHIKNTGYRFSGRMPREIVFPWMIVKVGRNRSRVS